MAVALMPLGLRGKGAGVLGKPLGMLSLTDGLVQGFLCNIDAKRLGPLEGLGIE